MVLRALRCVQLHSAEVPTNTGPLRPEYHKKYHKTACDTGTVVRNFEVFSCEFIPTSVMLCKSQQDHKIKLQKDSSIQTKIYKGMRLTNSMNGKTAIVLDVMPFGQVWMGSMMEGEVPAGLSGIVRQWGTTMRSIRQNISEGRYTVQAN